MLCQEPILSYGEWRQGQAELTGQRQHRRHRADEEASLAPQAGTASDLRPEHHPSPRGSRCSL